MLGALSAASSAAGLPAAGAQTGGPALPTTTATTYPAPVPPSPAPGVPHGDPVGAATISVVGRGESRAVPGVAVLTLGVEVRAGTVAEAQRLAADRAQAVIAALRESGVGQTDIQTVGLWISPIYPPPGGDGAPGPEDAPSEVEAYVVRNTVEATVREVGRTGEFLEAAVSAGGEAAVVSSVRFELAEDDAALSEARADAWDDVRNRADELAALAGGTLGRVLSVDEQTTTSGAPIPVTRADQVGTPVDPGTVSATVTLSARFELLVPAGAPAPPATAPQRPTPEPQS